MTSRRSQVNPKNPRRTPGGGIDQAFYDALRADNENAVEQAKKNAAGSGNNKTVRIVLHLPSELAGSLLSAAIESGRSASDEINEAIRFWLELQLSNEM